MESNNDEGVPRRPHTICLAWLQSHGVIVKVPHVKDTFRHVAHISHVTYFGSVWWEAHGLYASMGGVLLILGVANYFLHYE